MTLACIRNLRKLFIVRLLIFPGGRQHTGSSAFKNCFKLGRVNGPSLIVLQVGKAPLKEALAVFSDFVPAAVNWFHCPWLMRPPSLFLVFFYFFLSLLCLNSLLSWFILAIQCARHENLYIYHTPVWTSGHDISKLFFPYTFVVLFFFFLNSQMETLSCEDWNRLKMVKHLYYPISCTTCSSQGGQRGRSTALLWFSVCSFGQYCGAKYFIFL